jgi:hypothetical protein
MIHRRDIEKPVEYQTGKSSRGRMGDLLWMSNYGPPSNFDPDEITWITPDIAVTDWEGGIKAKEQGDLVICVAGEKPDLGHVCIPVDPRNGRNQTIKTLDRISELVRWAIADAGQRVVVHCAMGIERSVLAVVWYLHRYESMTLDEAYDTVGYARPIAADRRHWVGMK